MKKLNFIIKSLNKSFKQLQKLSDKFININTKQDERRDKYIENGRKYIIDELNTCANTSTKIHKELVYAGLIEEECQGLNLSYITYIKHYETI